MNSSLLSNKMFKKVLQYILLSLVGIIFLLPLVYLLSNSFKTFNEIIQFPPTIIPKNFLTSNYTELFNPNNPNYVPMPTFIKNSFLVCIGTVIGTVISTVMVGYAFARLPCRLKNVLFIILLSTLMIPSSVLVIPIFKIFRDIHFLNSLKALIVPSFFGNAFYIFFMRQFLMGIPYELDEAAYIDGATKLQILFKVLLPLCKPVLMSITVLEFVATWTDFYSPLIYLTSENKMTLAVGLAMFQGQRQSLLGLLSAATVISIVPMILLFFSAQKYFVEGISFSGMKA